MTELDKKLLFELDRDGRASYTNLAKKLNSSPQVIKYHLEKLIDEGIIKHFWAFIDYDKAGFPIFWGYWLKFSGLTKESEFAMYADLKTNKNIPIIMRCDGYADAMLGIIGRDVFEHNKILQQVFAKYGKFISMSDIVVGLGFHKFSRSYLMNNAIVSREQKTSGGTTERAKISELDRKILSLLQIDGRMEFTKMAEKAGVSAGLVQKHYQRLIAEKVITKITYTLDLAKMEMQSYRTLLKIVQYDQKRIKELFDYCKNNPNIINYVKVMGNWQVMLDIEIKDRNKLRELIRDIKHKFKDIIFQIEINEVYQMDKFTQMAIEYPELV
jgi:DNA-binding Lrp family transcriptional regulator